MLDSHGSHDTFKFKAFLLRHKIMPMYMPAHSSHKLQPLDVSVFGLLKRAYRKQIQSYMRASVHALTKHKFLPAFKQAFQQSFTTSNILSGFRASGLVPFQPLVVLEKLSNFQTEEPLLDTLPWSLCVPNTYQDIDNQSSFISQRLGKLPVSSQPTLEDAIRDFAEGTKKMATAVAVLKAKRDAALAANAAYAQRQKKKQKVLNSDWALTIAEI